MEIYTVKPGDTLSSVAAAYGISEELLITLNDPPNPQNLAVGQKLLILIPQTVHTVQSGETLDFIARKYGITAVEIVQNNPYITNAGIYIGENLVISYEGQERSRKFIANGYTYTTIDNRILLRTLPYLTFLTIFTYGFNESGQLVEANDEYLIKTALNYGVAPIMLISTLTEKGNFSNELAGFLMANENVQDILIENIIDNIRKKGYYGLDIDFEYIPTEYAAEYAEFVSKATKRLNNEGYICMAALAPKTNANQPGLLYEAHNYATVGNAANLSLLMTYEWGYAYGPPMAVAPINSVERVVEYGVSEIPPQKILLGVPMYGYDWRLPFVRGETVGISLSPQQALERASRVGAEIMYDEQAQAPYYYYGENGREHVVWFEDASSVAAKMDLVRKYDLAGGGFWNINRYFPQCWGVVNYQFGIGKIV